MERVNKNIVYKSKSPTNTKGRIEPNKIPTRIFISQDRGNQTTKDGYPFTSGFSQDIMSSIISY